MNPDSTSEVEEVEATSEAGALAPGRDCGGRASRAPILSGEWRLALLVGAALRLWRVPVIVRIADIDTPETHPPRCAEEERLSEAATLHMRALLSDGPFTMKAIDRDEDRYGRKLRVAMRDGKAWATRWSPKA